MKHSAGPIYGSPNKHTDALPEFGRFVPAKNNLCYFGMLRYCFGRNFFDYRRFRLGRVDYKSGKLVFLFLELLFDCVAAFIFACKSRYNFSISAQVHV